MLLHPLTALRLAEEKKSSYEDKKGSIVYAVIAVNFIFDCTFMTRMCKRKYTRELFFIEVVSEVSMVSITKNLVKASSMYFDFFSIV